MLCWQSFQPDLLGWLAQQSQKRLDCSLFRHRRRLGVFPPLIPAYAKAPKMDGIWLVKSGVDSRTTGAQDNLLRAKTTGPLAFLFRVGHTTGTKNTKKNQQGCWNREKARKTSRQRFSLFFFGSYKLVEERSTVTLDLPTSESILHTSEALQVYLL